MMELLSVCVSVLAVLVSVVVVLRLWYRNTSGRCYSKASMKGKTVIITGATAGIGLHTAGDLVRRGARVILACRNLEKAAKVAVYLRKLASDGGEVIVRELDTSDLSSVRQFALEVLQTEKFIHVLVNNAGILGPETLTMTEDGLEITMATNHFGHFLLTNLLLARLKQSGCGRVVNVSSLAHKQPVTLDMASLNFHKDHDVYHKLKAYSRSKVCNVLFTLELANKLKGSGVTANSLHPGVVKTDIVKNHPNTFINVLIKLSNSIITKDPELGAQTNIYLAVAEELEGITGKYFADCKEAEPSELGRDSDVAKQLWEASEKAVQLRQEERHY